MPWRFPDSRRPVPTARLARAGLYLLGVSLLVPLLPPVATVLILGWLVLLALIALELWQRPPRGDVGVRREVRRLYHVGREAHYSVHLRNQGTRPLQVSVREVPPASLDARVLERRFRLEVGEEIQWTVQFTSLERGEKQLLPLGLRVSHPSGLIGWQGVVDPEDRITVAPGRPAGETAWLLGRTSLVEETGEKKGRRARSSWEFESLREYVVGDEVRRIDWKASARRSQPMVRQYQVEHNAEVILALDCGRLMGNLIQGIAKLDLAMTPVLDLAAVALRRGDRVGLLAFDSRPRIYLPPRAGLRHLETMTRHLASLPRSHDPTSYLRAVAHLESHHRKRCLVVVFTDFTDELSAGEMYANLATLSRRHLMVLVGVSDPHLEEIFSSEEEDTRNLFERAVAGQLLLERRRTLAKIERLGALTVDVEPRRLTGPVIRKYLEARLGDLL